MMHKKWVLVIVLTFISLLCATAESVNQPTSVEKEKSIVQPLQQKDKKPASIVNKKKSKSEAVSQQSFDNPETKSPSPYSYQPTEKISEDLSVAYPTDI